MATIMIIMIDSIVKAKEICRPLARLREVRLREVPELSRNPLDNHPKTAYQGEQLALRPERHRANMKGYGCQFAIPVRRYFGRADKIPRMEGIASGFRTLLLTLNYPRSGIIQEEAAL
jgi:hypothetical protein